MVGQDMERLVTKVVILENIHVDVMVRMVDTVPLVTIVATMDLTLHVMQMVIPVMGRSGMIVTMTQTVIPVPYVPSMACLEE